jgi:acetyl-CoA synthetase
MGAPTNPLTWPAEVEACLLEHPAVSEAAVIGIPDELTGEGVVAFVVLKPGTHLPDAGPELAAHVAHAMGSAFRPRAVLAVPDLPKTQSGKVVRRLIRQAYQGEPLGDTSTLENPAALRHFASVNEPRPSASGFREPPRTKGT